VWSVTGRVSEVAAPTDGLRGGECDVRLEGDQVARWARGNAGDWRGLRKWNGEWELTEVCLMNPWQNAMGLERDAPRRGEEMYDGEEHGVVSAEEGGGLWFRTGRCIGFGRCKRGKSDKRHAVRRSGY
jgi:hypothetical protein